MKIDSVRRDPMRTARLTVAGQELLVYREPIARHEDSEHGLSGAEEEVIALLLEGLSLNEVARRRATRVEDVVRHVDTACRKLGIETEPEERSPRRTRREARAFGVAS